MRKRNEAGGKRILLLLCCILTGCHSREVMITFAKDHEFQLHEKIHGCSLIERIDGERVKRSDIDRGQIIWKETEVNCPLIDTERIGSGKAIVQYKGKQFPFAYTVKDELPPVFRKNPEEVTVIKGTKEKEILGRFSAEDDSLPVTYALDGTFDLEKEGVYEGAVIACDPYRNCSRTQVKITVKEKKKQKKSRAPVVKNQPVVEEAPSVKNEIPVQQPEKPEVQEQKKQFLIADGYSYESAYAKCIGDGEHARSNGYHTYSCTPIKQGEEYSGYLLIIK